MSRDPIHELIFGRERWAAMPDGVDEMRAKYAKLEHLPLPEKVIRALMAAGVLTKPKKKRKKKA
jgi:hypothetical protein